MWQIKTMGCHFHCWYSFGHTLYLWHMNAGLSQENSSLTSTMECGSRLVATISCSLNSSVGLLTANCCSVISWLFWVFQLKDMIYEQEFGTWSIHNSRIKLFHTNNNDYYNNVISQINILSSHPAGKRLMDWVMMLYIQSGPKDS